MVKIAEIVRQNPWWNQGRDFAQNDLHLTWAIPIFFKRQEPDFKRGNIYILRGPRQVGKTTYLKYTAKRLIESGIAPARILYLSFDFFTSRRELRNAINFFLDSTVEADEVYLLFDEISALDDWNLELKYLADQGMAEKSVIIATGSSAVKLKAKSELLPGRGLEGNEYLVNPLSFRAFLLQALDILCDYISDSSYQQAFSNLKNALLTCSIDLNNEFRELKTGLLKIIPFKRELQYLFRIYMITGGNPGVINHYLVNRFEKQAEMIDPTVSEIFMRDVLGDLAKLQKQETVARGLLKAILDRFGSRYSFTKLSQAIDHTHVTAIDYLEILGNSFILHVLYAYDFNRKAIKLKGDKKIYFVDPFIYYSIKSYLGGREVWDIITETLWNEELQAGLVEGMVILHLLQHKEIPYLRSGNTFLWMYYDKSGREIDALFKTEREYLGIEVKYQAQVHEKDVRRIAPVKNYLILSKDEVAFKNNVLIVPVDVFLSLLTGSDRNL